jgi:carbon monoxide dehydrogenase subunit G
MQMTGQQRIAAPRPQVWAALFDPDTLRQSIPGCQSLTKESDQRMRATAEIKIGPIGARFNATVTLSDIEPPNGYTMTVEGQGGTVGIVKSAIKVRLADDAGGATLLSYEVDAQIAGRLAQLGGPIIDATAKQLANRFFQQFGALVGQPAAAAVADAPIATARTPAVAAPGIDTLRSAIPPAAAPSRSGPLVWMLSLALAALIGYLVGHAQHGAESDWMGLALGLLLLVVAAAGFEYGRRAAAPVVMLDPALLARLSQVAKQ